MVPLKSQSSQSRQSRMNKERPEPPKQALTKCELVLHMVKDLGLAGQPPTSVGRLSEFALSAVTHTSAPVRKQGEKISLALYAVDPDRVLRVFMPALDGPDGRNMALRKLMDEFDRRDSKARS